MRLITLIFGLLFTITLSAQNFKYLGTYDSQGVPDYLEPENDVITYESMQMIKDALPEGYPVPEYNPHYISAGYDTDIALQKEANVWVTFVAEGAGYKNVLGFYTYDLSDPNPARPNDSDITIIFPNGSEAGYGGGLQVGNKVKLGKFPAGTGIGWVLLANAWNGQEVTWGQWQVFSNPEYNPEANDDLKHHMVLLSDPDNERIYLGIEDIRRDYKSCDQDFNDAIFYVTADPYEAIKTQNFADIESSTTVSSANNGGLESNGKLAQRIAERNFSRLKNSYRNYKKSSQKKFSKKSGFSKSYADMDLSAVFPQTGMRGIEEARISSPEDLMGITNAEAVFSADYYEGENRVAAALCTKTIDGIYDHSKVICDRLNSSSLEDIRTIKLKGHELVMIKMLRANGQLEYAVNFSINKQDKLYSFWNIDDYPVADYVNFQVWGNNMGQVSSITGDILDQFEAQGNLDSESVTGKIPTVFVKKGFYKDGKFHLVIKNKTGESSFELNGKIRTTELSEEIDINREKNLSTAFEEVISIDSGSLFDAGIEIRGNNSPQSDALYLADGPWGIDYLEDDTQIEDFEITTDPNTEQNEDYRLERAVSLKGKTYGTANVFRTILPGDQAFTADDYEALAFNIQNTSAIEVILVTEELKDWDQRFRIQLDANTKGKDFNIRLSDFSNGNQNYTTEKLKAVVFSVLGSYSGFKEFELSVGQLAFTTYSPSEELSIEDAGLAVSTASVYNYPNPFKDHTTIVVPQNAKTAELYIYDLNGKKIWSTIYEAAQFKHQLPVEIPGVKTGLYKALVLVDGKEKFTLSLLVD